MLKVCTLLFNDFSTLQPILMNFILFERVFYDEQIDTNHEWYG